MVRFCEFMLCVVCARLSDRWLSWLLVKCFCLCFYFPCELLDFCSLCIVSCISNFLCLILCIVDILLDVVVILRLISCVVHPCATPECCERGSAKNEGVKDVVVNILSLFLWFFWQVSYGFSKYSIFFRSFAMSGTESFHAKLNHANFLFC